MSGQGLEAGEQWDTATSERPRRPGPSWFVTVCKLAKPHFMFQWVTAFAFGYLASAGSSFRHVTWAVLGGIGVCVTHTAFTLHNGLTDRDEDTINQPGRVALLLHAGEGTVRLGVVLGYAALGLGLVPIARAVGADVVAWSLLAAVLAVTYNAGPRFKRRPVMAEIATGSAILAVFLAGWTWHKPASEVPAAGLFLGFVVAVTTFAKDLPDADGDAAIGAPGLFNVSSRTFRRTALIAIFVGPYGVLCGLVASGLVPARLLALLVLLPGATLLAAAAASATDDRAMLGTYHLSLLYRNTFSATMLVLYVFTPLALAVAGVLFGAQVLMLRLRLDSRFNGEDEPSWKDLATATWSAAARHP